jgi:gamma-glutamyltranspeptidase/glutathione hydrolase
MAGSDAARLSATALSFMGDTDFVKVPTSQLIRKSYASEFRKRFNPDKASDSLALPARVLPANEATETTHFSVVDKDGNAVANTYTLNGGYGSGVTIEGTGILMNNEMDDFTSKPGVPNAYGLIQGDANAIARGKRPLSAMTPTFLLREGKLFLVIGSPGGPTIINTVLQVIVNVVDFGLDDSGSDRCAPRSITSGCQTSYGWRSTVSLRM